MFSWKVLCKRLIMISIVTLFALVVGNATYYLFSLGGDLPCNDCYTNALWIFTATSSPIETLKAATLGAILLGGLLSGVAVFVGGPLCMLGETVKECKGKGHKHGNGTALRTERRR